jgi:hypothetical protein
MAGKNNSKSAQARSAQKAVARARSGQRRGGVLFAGGAAIVVALLVVVIVVVVNSRGGSDTAAPDLSGPPATTAVGRDTPPPWPAPADVAGAVRAAGLPMLSAEGTVEHIHAHLDVLIDGRGVEVPGLIGIDQAGGSISPLHTHDTTGVIHIESPVARVFTLGEFFSEWGVSLTADNIGALHAAEGKTLRAYVNGHLRPGNPAVLTMNAHDEIALVYGLPQASAPVPSSFTFPAGE